MDSLIFFLIKFFPVWSASLFIILLPLSYNLFKLKKRTAFIFVVLIMFILSVALYFYFTRDGYKNAVEFVRQFIV